MEDSKMAIGRSEDRNTPRNPTMLRHRVHVQGPDPRNPSGPAVDPTAHTGRTHDRNRPDPFELPHLANRGPSTHGFRVASLRSATGMTMRAPRTVALPSH